MVVDPTLVPPEATVPPLDRRDAGAPADADAAAIERARVRRLGPLADAVAFVARFLGRDASAAQLIGVVPNGATSRRQAAIRLAHAAGLAASVLDGERAPQASELPALALGNDRRGEERFYSSVVVIARRGERFECRLRGSEASLWLDAAQIAEHLGSVPRWVSVRAPARDGLRGWLERRWPSSWWIGALLAKNRRASAMGLAGLLAVSAAAMLLALLARTAVDAIVPRWAMAIPSVLAAAAAGFVLVELARMMLRGQLLEAWSRRLDLVWDEAPDAGRTAADARRVDPRRVLRPSAQRTMFGEPLRHADAVRQFVTGSASTLFVDLPLAALAALALVVVAGPVRGHTALLPPLLVGVALPLLLAAVARLIRSRPLPAPAPAAGAAWPESLLPMSATPAAMATGAHRPGGWIGPVATAVTVLAAAAVVAVGALLVRGQEMSLGQMVAVAMLAAIVLAPGGQLARLALRRERVEFARRTLDRW